MFACCVLLCADVAVAQTIKGTATYKERMALPAGSIFEVTLEDVSRAGAPALVIATSRIASPGKPVPAQDANREAHLVFEAGNRVAGSDGWIAARSDRQAVGLHQIVCDEGRSSVSVADGRRRDLRVRADHIDQPAAAASAVRCAAEESHEAPGLPECGATRGRPGRERHRRRLHRGFACVRAGAFRG
ncbi:MAG: hypothetical protein EHM55_00395 [Acidobacteria bacterium]|nr:MAG: hypothetical protein EHM55_00395 [Acidobacteriota bacterium]